MISCARCNRRLKGAFTKYLGQPFGPVCAKIMGLKPAQKDRAGRVVRDTQTLDLFEGQTQ
jgi:hypothetical protein